MVQSRQQASVELSVILHGDAAILGPSPPGPDVCTDRCPWCYHQGVAILQPRDTQTELAEGVG